MELDLVALLFWGVAVAIDAVLTFYPRLLILALLGSLFFPDTSTSNSIVGWFILIGIPLPYLWSLIAWFLPSGNSLLYRLKINARKPTDSERAYIHDMFKNISDSAARVQRWPHDVYIIPSFDSQAEVLGSTLYVHTELLELPQEQVQAVLGHELGHLNALDGRLGGALTRLTLPFCFWLGNIFHFVGSVGAASVEASDHTDNGVAQAASLGLGCAGLILSLLGLLFYFAAGGLGTTIVAFVMQVSGYSRAREFAADRYAADHGQAQGLIDFLTHHALVGDTIAPTALLSGILGRIMRSHPFTAFRIDRLRQYLAQPSQIQQSQQGYRRQQQLIQPRSLASYAKSPQPAEVYSNYFQQLVPTNPASLNAWLAQWGERLGSGRARADYDLNPTTVQRNKIDLRRYLKDITARTFVEQASELDRRIFTPDLLAAFIDAWAACYLQTIRILDQQQYQPPNQPLIQEFFCPYCQHSALLGTPINVKFCPNCGSSW